MPDPSFTFYGVVDDGDASVGNNPAAFGLTAGAHVAGSLVLTGAAAAAYAAAIGPSGKGVLNFQANTGAVLSFPQGAVRTWTAQDVVPAAFDNIQIVSASNKLPLVDLAMGLYPLNAADGPNLSFNQFNVGAAHFTDDDDQQAFVYGVWMPSGVTPKLYYGDSGANTLKAKGAVALAWGGLGADKITMDGDGVLYAWAGQGNDTVSGDDGQDHIFGDSGNDTLKGGHDDDKLYGGSGADKIQGDDGDDFIDGGSGNDQLKGGEGDDVITGGTGVDDIKGEDGDDTLYSANQGPGDTGYSHLDGGDGDDVLIAWTVGVLKGGSGNDTFIVGDGESPYGVAHVVIEDFNKQGHDRIHISVPGVDSFSELMSFARQDGKDVVFDLYPAVWDEPLTLIGVKIGNLHASDFIFDAPDP